LAQGGIAVSPSKLYFQGEPGQVVTREITLQNPTELKIDLLTYFADWERDSFGTKIYYEPGTLHTSCQPWVSFPSEAIHLEPGQIRKFQISMKIPEKEIPTSEIKNCMLFLKQDRALTSRKEEAKTLQSDMDVFFQIGLHIYYIPNRLNRKELEIRNLEKDAEHELNIALENTGDYEVEAKIKLELTNKGTGEEYVIFKDPKRVSFLPGDFRYVRMELPTDLPTGAYSALTIVDIDPNLDLQIGMLDFDL